MAPRGIASVTTENADRNSTAAMRAISCLPLRQTMPLARSPMRLTTWPTVVRACSWLDELYAGQSTRAMANKLTTATSAATAVAATIWPVTASAVRIR